MLGIGRCVAGGEESGTAFIIAEDLALTAFHCVGDRSKQGLVHREVTLRFRLGARTVEISAEASESDSDARLDVAMLRLKDALPPEIEAVAISSEADRGEPWWAIGYPAAVSDGFSGVSLDQASVHGELTDVAASLDDGTPVLAMFCEEGAAGLSLHGLSGAPVLVGGSGSSATRAVGLVRYNPPDARDPELAAGGVVVAAPIEAIVRAWPQLRGRLVAPTLEARRLRLVRLVEIAPGADGRLPTVKSVDPYRLRVSDSPYGTVGIRNDPYVPRDLDDDLDRALVEDPFVLVVGPSKAGKSRTAFESVCRVLPGAAMFVPIPESRALQVLDEDPAVIDAEDRPLVVWLDDFDRYLSLTDGLTRELLARLAERRAAAGRPRLTVLATLTTTKREQLRSQGGGELERAAAQLIASARELALESDLSDTERVDAQTRYPEQNFEGGVGIGERLVAAPLLRQRYLDAGNPAGWCLVQAAVDWRRVGLLRPIPEDQLRQLAVGYLEERWPALDLTDQTYGDGLKWARAPVAQRVSLLDVAKPVSTPRCFEPFDFIIALCDGQDGKPRPVRAAMWQEARSRADAAELVGVGLAAYRALRPDDAGLAWAAASETDPSAAVNLGLLRKEQGDPAGAAAAWQLAIDSGHADYAPMAAVNLGGLRQEQGDPAGAEAAWQLAIDSGHADYAPMAAFNLGLLRQKQGDPAGAEAAFQLAIDSGHADQVPKAAAGLGLLRKEQGDPAGAEAAFQLAMDSGHADQAAKAAFNLGVLRQEQGDPAGAEAAWQLAIDSGHADQAAKAAFNLGLLRKEQGDPAGAEAAFQLAMDSGHADQAAKAAVGLGVLRQEQGDPTGAEAAYQLAIDSGHADHAPMAAFNLGVLRKEQGDPAGAAAAWQLVIDSGHVDYAPMAAFNLGLLRQEQGDPAGAAAAWQLAMDSGHADQAPMAAFNLGVLRQEQGDPAGAAAAFQLVIDSGHADQAFEAAFNLGVLRKEQGDPAGAEAAWQLAMDSGHADQAPMAAFNLGVLRKEQGDPAGTAAAWQLAIDSGHADYAPMAAFNLGGLRQEQGDPAGAEAAWQLAMDSGHADYAPMAAFNLGLLRQEQGES